MNTNRVTQGIPILDGAPCVLSGWQCYLLGPNVYDDKIALLFYVIDPDGEAFEVERLVPALPDPQGLYVHKARAIQGAMQAADEL